MQKACSTDSIDVSTTIEHIHIFMKIDSNECKNLNLASNKVTEVEAKGLIPVIINFIRCEKIVKFSRYATLSRSFN